MANMITKKDVRLTFNHQTEGPVYVAGSFNGWRVDQDAMKQSGKGSWEITLQLPPGEHQFRYFANGAWFTDYAADGVVPNGMGGFNSVLKVKEASAASKAATAGRRVVQASASRSRTQA